MGSYIAEREIELYVKEWLLSGYEIREWLTGRLSRTLLYSRPVLSTFSVEDPSVSPPCIIGCYRRVEGGWMSIQPGLTDSFTLDEVDMLVREWRLLGYIVECRRAFNAYGSLYFTGRARYPYAETIKKWKLDLMEVYTPDKSVSCTYRKTAGGKWLRSDASFP